MQPTFLRSLVSCFRVMLEQLKIHILLTLLQCKMRLLPCSWQLIDKEVQIIHFNCGRYICKAMQISALKSIPQMILHFIASFSIEWWIQCLKSNWWNRKTRCEALEKSTAVVIIIKGFMFCSSKRPILRGVGGTQIGLPRPYKLGPN